MLGLSDASRESVIRLNLSRRTGVYFIRNRINDKIYVGSASTSFSSRFRQHANDLRKGIHGNKHLQRAWGQYGPLSFEWGVVEDCVPEQCVQCEQKWIDFFNPEYNICLVAGSCRGVKRSESAKAKIAASKIGRPRSEETKAKLSIAAIEAARRPDWKGIHHSDEGRRKMSEANKGHQRLRGRKQSEEHKKNKNAALVGKKRTQETCRRIGLSKSGRVTSESTKLKLSKFFNGRKFPSEVLSNMRAKRAEKKDSAL